MGLQHWIPIDNIVPFIGLEAFIICGALSGGAWGFYRIALIEVSLARHENLKKRFARLAFNLTFAVLCALASWAAREHAGGAEEWLKAGSYFGFLALIFGIATTVFLAQILLYLYLFRANMRVGVPRLIVNIFTLVFASILVGWLSAEIFGLRIMPLLATSAIFSVVLGLALQDTLGNLFSGLALQLDSPYRIGDWVEVQHESQRWMGQIQEISWRATLLQGFGNELITVPNRTMAQSQVLVLSADDRQARRNHGFRIPFNSSIDVAKKTLLEVAHSMPQILRDPAPVVLILDVSDSWATVKIFYTVNDFGLQYRIGDEFLSRALIALNKAGVPLAHPRVELVNG